MKTKQNNEIKQRGHQSEQGFIMVASLVLLSILTLLGAAATFKTIIEVKVANMSGATQQALAVANSGLQKQFMEWGLDSAVNTVDGDQSEFAVLVDDIRSNSNNAGIYVNVRTPTSVEDLRDRFAANLITVNNIDVWVQTAGDVRVFELSDAGMAVVDNYTWALPSKSSVQQVALWVTSFKPPADDADYPYASPNVAACNDCRMVVYALGRFQQSYRLVRQSMNQIQAPQLVGASAMTNAPLGNDFNEICAGTAIATPTDYAYVTAWDPLTTGSAGNGSALIEATQAIYTRGTVPSGTALASNTELGIGGKEMRSGTSNKSGTTFESTPYIVYSGHGPGTSGVRVDWANKIHDTTAADLPSGKLPTKLINASLLGTNDEIKYFTGAETQLFNMDAYRWGAEQFTCQNTANADGVNGNGKFCSKANRLRKALNAYLGSPALAPVTGRLTIAEFEYNVANSIPMFGLVRVMFPAEYDAPGCNGKDLHVISTAVPGNVEKLKAGGTYDGTPTTLDADGNLGASARMIIYGSLLVDYYKDDAGGTDNDGIYQGNGIDGGAEWLLSPIESQDVYLAIEHNIMINPVMPDFLGAAPSAFPTAFGGPNGSAMTMVDINNVADAASGNTVNLASPRDGYFPWVEGLIGAAQGEGPAGTMRLMSLTDSNSLLSAMKEIEANPGIAIPTTKMTNMLTRAKPVGAGLAGKESDVLKYYYKLLVESVQYGSGKLPKDQAWPIAPWPGDTLAGNFYIGQEDKDNTNNDGDKTHLMFPGGNAHGWKVALAALDMQAAEWNTLLVGITALNTQVVAGCGGAACPKGVPFGDLDSGYTDVATIEADGAKYFYITPDAGTGYGLLDADWKDIPSTLYSGGLLDMHAHSNMNGIVYTPGPLEWEPGNSKYDPTSGFSKGPHMSYVSGAIITGSGSYTKNKRAEDRYVLVFDPQSMDNIPVNSGDVIILRRFAWQELR